MTNRKTILITGSNKGIGFEIARQTARLGFQVIISGRDESRVKQAQKQLQNENLYVHILIMDVSKPESIHTAAQRFGSKGNRLDVLVNNAGIGIKGDVGLLKSS